MIIIYYRKMFIKNIVKHKHLLINLRKRRKNINKEKNSGVKLQEIGINHGFYL